MPLFVGHPSCRRYRRCFPVEAFLCCLNLYLAWFVDTNMIISYLWFLAEGGAQQFDDLFQPSNVQRIAKPWSPLSFPVVNWVNRWHVGQPQLCWTSCSQKSKLICCFSAVCHIDQGQHGPTSRQINMPNLKTNLPRQKSKQNWPRKAHH